MSDLIAFDLETTGRSPDFDRITEIGAYNLTTGEKFSTFAYPEKKIPKNIQELTHITDEMVKDAPSQREAIEAFLQFAGKNPIFLGHNLSFDIRFIVATLDRLGMEIPEIKYIDTLPISRAAYPDLEHHKLGNLCELYGITNEAAHRAFEDAEATAKVYQCLHEEWLDGRLCVSDDTFDPRPAVIKIAPATDKQIAFINSLLNQLDIDEKYISCGKSAASKKIAELLALKEEREKTYTAPRL